MAVKLFRQIGAIILRHQFVIWDMSVVVGAGSLLALLGIEYDLLLISGSSSNDAVRLEFEEVLLILAVLGALLWMAVRRMQAQQHEVERRTIAERRARELAFQDPLTGLANRRKFDEAVRAAVAAPPGAGCLHAVLLLDLNGFKKVNDVFGHPAGDEVLVEVGQRLTSVARQNSDLAARFGGDEFGIVATHLRSTEEVNGIALRIIQVLSLPIVSEKGEHTIGAGVGIALFPRDGGTPEELVRRADVALYRAKTELISNVCFFEEQMDVQVHERAFFESELRIAIASGDIQPHYQPIFDLATGEIIGFEALARWQHPKLGHVSPDRFIPVAEDCGLIRDLGNYLLRTACLEACNWPDHATLSFNISPLQLRDASFGLRVLSILDETGLPAKRLELEITENALVRDLNTAQQALAPLRQAGVRVSLDDFGTGYSSLYHLRNFKIDRIKIDRSFVDSMSREIESAAIVRALIGLGRGLGVQITAEGIERPETMAALIHEGCAQGQGFLFSPALQAAAAAALFKSNSHQLGHKDKIY